MLAMTFTKSVIKIIRQMFGAELRKAITNGF
jgi:hypothetical protein